MQQQTSNNSRAVSQSKIHLKNINLHRAGSNIGMVGERHSKLIDKLAAQVENKKRELALAEVTNVEVGENEKELAQKIVHMEREEANLKREMIRISQMAKSYKNSRIQIEIKHQSLYNQYSKCKKRVEELESKITVLTEFNSCLMKITENSLQILPQYEDDCQGLFSCFEKLKEDLKGKTSHDEVKITSSIADAVAKLDLFRCEVDKIQTYQKKLISNLSDAHWETKTINQRMSMLSDLGQIDILTLRQNINQLNQNLALSEINESQVHISNPLAINSVISETIIPESASRMTKIFQEICLMFEHHIHLLETQKMEYQFTKNKKLIACQKYECEICESYEKIVSHIFSIVREAFKEVKFQFLREIKQISDISEIPFLI